MYQNQPSIAQPTLKQLVRIAYEKGFSDIHLGIGKVPSFRDRGEIKFINCTPTDETTFFTWLREVLKEEQIQEFQQMLDFDSSAEYEFVRVRLNLFYTFNGAAMVLRLIPLKIPTLAELGFPEIFGKICHFPSGLVLVTGPTGSGKSTTLAGMVNYINQTMAKHIVTIEDPIEFVHKDSKSIISQREVGLHTWEFGRALKAVLREDPDIILIGEMRDRETVDTALKAAQTGHLVMGTLHTRSAVQTIERILNLYNGDEQEPMRIQLAESLAAAISQALVRTNNGKRVAAYEILVNTETIKDYIKKDEIEALESIISKSEFYGMCTMNKSLHKLYEAGRITQETAMDISPKPSELAILIKGGYI